MALLWRRWSGAGCGDTLLFLIVARVFSHTRLGADFLGFVGAISKHCPVATVLSFVLLFRALFCTYAVHSYSSDTAPSVTESFLSLAVVDNSAVVENETEDSDNDEEMGSSKRHPYPRTKSKDILL